MARHRTLEMINPRRLERMRDVLRYRQQDLTLVCENIHDPHNVSAILRSCDAVGLEQVQLLYNEEVYPKLAEKSSASARKWIDTLTHKDPESLAKRLKARGFRLYATHLGTAAVSIHEVDWTQPSAIILGNEHRGISPELLAQADANIKIPMFGMIQSLNVSVAAAVILYEACRQRIAKGSYTQGSHDHEWIEERLLNWIKR